LPAILGAGKLPETLAAAVKFAKDMLTQHHFFYLTDTPVVFIGTYQTGGQRGNIFTASNMPNTYLKIKIYGTKIIFKKRIQCIGACNSSATNIILQKRRCRQQQCIGQ
jgi:hypothetical protein